VARKGVAFWRALSLMTNIGLTMALSVLIGYFMGHYLDKWILHKEDYVFTIVFSLFGIAAGFRVIFRLINESLQDQDKE
jgi:F0F1-type ATP synthase assembly protein I